MTRLLQCWQHCGQCTNVLLLQTALASLFMNYEIRCLSIQGKFVAFHLSGFNPAIFIKKFLPKFIAKHLNHISQLSNGAILACLMWLLQLITLKKRIQKQMRKICAPLSFDRPTCLGKERTATHTHLFEALLRCLGVWTHYEIPF